VSWAWFFEIREKAHFVAINRRKFLILIYFGNETYAIADENS
jgi:hypothetical protein